MPITFPHPHSSDAHREILDLSYEFSTKVDARRMPQLSRHQESNVSGLYIVGDLADAPVIPLALSQGFGVVEGIVERDFAKRSRSTPSERVDVVIVGAGPAGIGAALACKKHGLRYVIVERERPLNTIQNFPKHKPLFNEARTTPLGSRFHFVHTTKEDLLAQWERALDEQGLVIRQPEEVVDIRRVADGFAVATRDRAGQSHTILGHKVVLAIGRRGSVKKLGIEGEEHKKVLYSLRDPNAHPNERVLVVGGGDSAVEAAIALANGGAHVTIAHRGDAFLRPQRRNRRLIEELVRAGRITVYFGTKIERITETDVVLEGPGGVRTLANDRVFVLIGTDLPVGFLKKIGVQMEGAFSLGRVLWIAAFFAITYAFYCIKTHKTFFPFGPNDPLAIVHDLVTVPFGSFVDGTPRQLTGSFWGTVVYSLMVTGFGVLAIRKYRSPAQTRRYLSLIGFQLVFLFVVPEIIAPLMIAKPWRMYALSVPWPLSIWSLIHQEIAWVAFGAFVAFVAIPLYVRFFGERFCSWMCGCGGLAETLGDRWRHLAPRGPKAKRAEVIGRIVLGLAALTTVLILFVDIFRFVEGAAWTSGKAFAQHWYGLMVDFWFAAIVGVASYPYLGNRVWCRFLCPLRAYMEILAKRFGRPKIVSNERCIGCGECTRQCQMGIGVQGFAQAQRDLTNQNSACIQCGICIEVCPMDVLTFGRRAKGDVR